MSKFPVKFMFILFLAVLLASCNLPYSQIPPTEPPDAAYTAAAETIVAQLTEVFPISTLMPSPTTTQAEVVNQISPTPTQEPTVTLTPQPSLTLAPTATVTPADSDPRAALGDPDWTRHLKIPRIGHCTPTNMPVLILTTEN